MKYPHGFDDRWFPDKDTAEYVARYYNSQFSGMFHFAEAIQHGTGWLVALMNSADADENGPWIVDYLPGNFQPGMQYAPIEKPIEIGNAQFHKLPWSEDWP